MAQEVRDRPHLLSLPPEIREQIYGLLLHPSANRTTDRNNYVKYHYGKALVLFRLNRQIYNEAHKVFYDLNPFVRIETPWPQAKAHVLIEGHVPIVVEDEHAKNFKHERLRVRIDAPGYEPMGQYSEGFIIHVDDLPRFTKSWFYADLTHPSLNANLNLTLQLHDPFAALGHDSLISIPLQKRLFEPWGLVKNLQAMLITGPLQPDPKIRADLATAQATPPERPEHCLRECVRFKGEANAQLQAGNYREALATYNQAWEAIHITVYGRSRHVHSDDFFAVEMREAPYEGKIGQAERLVLRVQLVANTVLAYLKLQEFDECIFWGMRTIGMMREGMGLDPDAEVAAEVEAVPGFLAAVEMGKIYWRVALAHKALDEKMEARRLLRVAMIYLTSPKDQRALEEAMRGCMLSLG